MPSLGRNFKTICSSKCNVVFGRTEWNERENEVKFSSFHNRFREENAPFGSFCSFVFEIHVGGDKMTPSSHKRKTRRG